MFVERRSVKLAKVVNVNCAADQILLLDLKLLLQLLELLLSLLELLRVQSKFVPSNQLWLWSHG